MRRLSNENEEFIQSRDHPDEGGHHAFLTPTVTVTPASFGERRRTTATPLPWPSTSKRTLANRAEPGGQRARELQNQWSASLAMSTDGSFPSRPRKFSEYEADTRGADFRRAI
jgi:hypothetical protein